MTFVTIAAGSYVSGGGFDNSFQPGLGSQVSGWTNSQLTTDTGAGVTDSLASSFEATYNADGSVDYVVDTTLTGSAVLNSVSISGMNSSGAGGQVGQSQSTTTDSTYLVGESYRSEQHHSTEIDPATGEEVELEDSTTTTSSTNSRTLDSATTGTSRSTSSAGSVTFDITTNTTAAETDNYSSNQSATKTIDQHADGSETVGDVRSTVTTSDGSSSFLATTSTSQSGGSSGSSGQGGGSSLRANSSDPPISIAFAAGSSSEWSVSDTIHYNDGAFTRDLSDWSHETGDSSSSFASDPSDPDESFSDDFFGTSDIWRLETIDPLTNEHRIEVTGLRSEDSSSSYAWENGSGARIDNSSVGTTTVLLTLIKTGDYDPQTGTTDNWQIITYSYDSLSERSAVAGNSQTAGPPGSGGPPEDISTEVTNEWLDRVVASGSGTNVTQTNTHQHTRHTTNTTGNQSDTVSEPQLDMLFVTDGGPEMAHLAPGQVTSAGSALIQLTTGVVDPVGTNLSGALPPSGDPNTAPPALNLQNPTVLADGASSQAFELYSEGGEASETPAAGEGGLTDRFGNRAPEAEPIVIGHGLCDSECHDEAAEDPADAGDPVAADPDEPVEVGVYEDLSGDEVGIQSRLEINSSPIELGSYSIEYVTRNSIAIPLSDVEAFDKSNPTADAAEWDAFFSGFADGTSGPAVSAGIQLYSGHPFGSDEAMAYAAGYVAGQKTKGHEALEEKVAEAIRGTTIDFRPPQDPTFWDGVPKSILDVFGGNSPPPRGGYVRGVGQVFVGYGNAATGIVTGIWDMAWHPIQTAEGVYIAATHPAETFDAIWTDVKDKAGTNQGGGELAGDVLIAIASGGSINAARKAGWVAKVANKMPSGKTTAALVDDIAVRAQRWGQRKGLGSGGRAGSLQHGYADRLLTRYQSKFGDRGLSTEVRYIDGRPWEIGDGLRGTVRLDVVEGPIDSPISVFDYKFGDAKLTTDRIDQLRRTSGIRPCVPFHQVKP